MMLDWSNLVPATLPGFFVVADINGYLTYPSMRTVCAVSDTKIMIEGTTTEADT